ncbi:replication-relaxation family protein [Lentibacillus salicampi]|uniref:replication-relaxation family protein n=1 Tax=Lentibacillus salicampi TaxID=175306 RepID=UPI001FD84CA1|nr:replication-relaxation family protein [Lentibacillus salicampi]
MDELTYATREQLQVVNNLAGDRNAQRILARMEKDKIIQSVRHEKKVYFLSNRGKSLIGSSQGELKKSWIQHTLMRNDLYIRLGMPVSWKKEVPAKINGEIILVPDAMFTLNSEHYFVEIDNQQTMQTNNDKIKKYKQLSDVILKQFSHKPVLIWYTLSEIRRQKLKSACEQNEVNFKIY